MMILIAVRTVSTMTIFVTMMIVTGGLTMMIHITMTKVIMMMAVITMMSK